MLTFASLYEASLGIGMFILMNLPVGYAAWRLHRRFYTHLPAFHRPVVMGTLILGQVVLLQTILGAMGLLKPGYIILACLASAGLIHLLTPVPNTPGTQEETSSYRPLLAMWLIAVAALPPLAHALFLPPHDGDTIGYHLPNAVAWLQGQSLDADGIVAHYPGNGELLLLWVLIPFGHDLLASLPSFFLFLLAGYTLFCLARLLSLQSPAAWLPPLIFLSTPMVYAQLGSGGNDLMLAVTFFLTVHGLLLSRFDPKPAHLLLAAVGIGLLIGTKYNGSAYAALALILCNPWLPSTTWMDRIKTALPLAAGAFLLGSYWYIRNVLLTGNPFFPAEIRLGGFLLFNGEISSTYLASSSLFSHIGDAQALLSLAKALLLWGGPAGLGALAAILASPVLYRRSLASETRAAVFLPLAAFIVFITTPLTAENVPGTLNQISSGWSLRFGLPFLGCGTVIASILLRRLSPCTAKPLIALLVVAGIGLSAWQQIISPLQLVYATVAGGMGYLMLLHTSPWQALRRLRAFAWIGFLGLLIPLAALLVQARTEQRSAFYSRLMEPHIGPTELYAWLDRHAKQENILATGLRAYPLYGPRYKNRVYLSPFVKDADAWKKELADKGITLLVISRETGDASDPLFGQFPWQDTVARQSAETFSLVFADNLTRVYRVMPPSGPQHLRQPISPNG